MAPAAGSVAAPLLAYADYTGFGERIPLALALAYLVPLFFVALSWFGERTLRTRTRRIALAIGGSGLAFVLMDAVMGLLAVGWLVSNVVKAF
ncbi:hypothetical protein [Streptomyces yaizuensis]|uniref:Uncharacterized protein n=1 Tax=Streptomyces yaizuensis TaxID=2989713 RepID=A0ABQ5P3J3_9ACTN|nr:hypothetical protein [Streptomyces sp. YSPA8]GLF97181.1 hypothetical protein SYYSPA8_22810 [Streptomyces sp. YSPA8]